MCFTRNFMAFVAGVTLFCGGCERASKPSQTARAGEKNPVVVKSPRARGHGDVVEVPYSGEKFSEAHITSFLKIYFSTVSQEGHKWTATLSKLPPRGLVFSPRNPLLVTSKVATVQYFENKKTLRFQLRETKRETILSRKEHEKIVTYDRTFLRGYDKLSAAFLAREFSPDSQ